MAPKVDEKLIEKVREITEVSREDAKTAIRNMDFDLVKTVDYILSGAFYQDKSNQPSSSNSFAAGAKAALNTMKQYTTRSRSPQKNRKPSPSTAPAEIITVSEDEDYDEEMRRAVAMSLETAASSRGRSPSPSNRPLSGETSYFGPARSSDYHESEWGMVVSNASGQEAGVVDGNGTEWSNSVQNNTEDINLAPEERQKLEGQPVVLDTRGVSGAFAVDSVTKLAGLMTILHKVPKAREAFVLAAPRDPGIDNEPNERWWQGGQSMTTATSSDDNDITGESVLREAARIMAFLDETERSFGRLSEYLVSALQKDVVNFPRRGDSNENEISPTFLHRWSYIVNANFGKTYLTSSLPTLFNSHVHQPAYDAASSEQNEIINEILCKVPRALTDAGNHTILDALESAIWWGLKYACLKSFSEILLIRLQRDDHEGGAGVEILPKLPMNRFAYEFYDKMEDDSQKRKQFTVALTGLREKEERLTWVDKAGKKYSAAQVLETTLHYVEGMEGQKVVDFNVDDEDPSSQMDVDSETTLPGVAAQLRTSLESLTVRLQECQAAIQHMEDKMVQLFNFPDFIMVPPSENQTTSALGRRVSLNYILRGVIVDQHLTYFSQWENYTNPYKRNLVWFKSDFSTSKPEITIIEEGEVLTISRDRGKDGVITVYVRDDVPEVIEKVLPPEYLREYIQKDNESFRKELNPPVIQVTEPILENVDMDTEASAPPMTPERPGTPKNLNPFMTVEEMMEEMKNGSTDPMLVDDSVPPQETNPFRRSFVAREENGRNVSQDEEAKT